MNIEKTLKVTSNVGRDLLAAAASFKTEAAVIWEYVVNSLQYVDDGVSPKVQVIVKSRNKVIEIRDNGRGMDEEGLIKYFEMHGENVDRKIGRPGRGKFGTGKSAAFGIGKILRVDTRKNGTQNIVQLHRNSIDSSTGDDIPIDWVVRNKPTDFDNGTTINIEEIFISKISAPPVVEYVERHLQIFRARMPEVAINDHICQYREPIVSDVYTFRPNDQQERVLGYIELKIKMSSSPLPRSEQGISITAGLGNLVAIETAGVETKELGNYLFGEVDVPALESVKYPMEAYDATRTLQLNPHHPVAQMLLPFIGSKLEEVRRNQLQKLRAAQKTEEARRLASEAQRIAEILNKDFKNIIGRLQDIRSASAKPGDLSASVGNGLEANNEDGVWREGVEIIGDINTPNSSGKSNLNTKSGNLFAELNRFGSPNDEGQSAVDPVGGEKGGKSRPRGGFNVDFRSLGSDTDRSKYDRTTLTILINLDHPVVKSAVRNGGIENLNFKRLAYEIAFTEYAIALGYEMSEQDPDIPADDLLYEVRSTLNRISISAASLYG